MAAKDWPPEVEQLLGILGTLDVIVLRMERHLLEPVKAGDRSEEVIAKADRYSSELVGPMLRLGDWARAQRTAAS